MAVLTTKERKHLSNDQFGLPSERKYPVDNRAHAANAKARASEMYKAGHISKSQYDEINAAANKVLNR